MAPKTNRRGAEQECELDTTAEVLQEIVRIPEKRVDTSGFSDQEWRGHKSGPDLQSVTTRINFIPLFEF